MPPETLKTPAASAPSLQKAAATGDDVTRAMPHAMGPEKSILSSMLQDPQEYIGLAQEEKLTKDQFYFPAHATLYGFLVELYEGGHEIELVSLVQRLLDRGLLDHVGGPAAIGRVLAGRPAALKRGMQRADGGATAGFGVQPLPVPAHRVHMAEAVRDRAHQRCQHRVCGWRNAIVDPQALLLCQHQPALFQVRQMARRFGLRNPERFVDVAHAHFTAREQAKDPQPCGIGQSLVRKGRSSSPPF